MSEVKGLKNWARRWTHFTTSSSTGEHVMFVIAKTGGFIDNNQTHRNYATTSNGDVMQLFNSGPNANDPVARKTPWAGISRTFWC